MKSIFYIMRYDCVKFTRNYLANLCSGATAFATPAVLEYAYELRTFKTKKQAEKWLHDFIGTTTGAQPDHRHYIYIMQKPAD